MLAKKWSVSVASVVPIIIPEGIPIPLVNWDQGVVGSGLCRLVVTHFLNRSSQYYTVQVAYIQPKTMTQRQVDRQVQAT